MTPPATLREIVERLAHLSDLEAAEGSEARASVAAILRERDRSVGPELLFIRRAERAGDPWSGHMALPGGRRSPSDATILETAMRETLEEVGIDLRSGGRPVARLADIYPVSRAVTPLAVTPYVFVLDDDQQTTPNHEVAEAIWAPFTALARGEGLGEYVYERGGFTMKFPSIRVGDHPVWGMTYRLLERLLDELGGSPLPRDPTG